MGDLIFLEDLTVKRLYPFSRTFSFFLAAFLITHQATAANYSVFNSGDSGANTFREAIQNAAFFNPNGNDSISIFVGPLSVTSDMDPISKRDGATLTLDANNFATTINGGTNKILDLSGGGTFNARSLTISGIASNNIMVSGNSTLQMGGLNALNAGLVLDDSTLQSFSGLSGSKSVTLTGTGTFNVDATGMTLTGPMSGTGSLRKIGDGVLSLSGGAKTYNGGTSIQNGTLSVSGDNQLGTGNVQLQNGATLRIGNNAMLIRDFDMANGGGKLEVVSGAASINGVVAGTDGLTKTGAGMLSLLGFGSYNGGTVLKEGVLAVADDYSLGSVNSNITFDGGSLRTLGDFTSNRNISLLQDGVIDNETGSQINLSGNIDGNASFTLNGTGLKTLSGFNTHLGDTIINNGTLSISQNANLGIFDNKLRLNDATLTNTNTLIMSRQIDVTGLAGVNTPFDMALNGNISGSGSLVKTGAGALALGGLNNFSGPLTINGGSVVVSQDLNLGGNSTVNLNDSTLRLTQSNLFSKNILMDGNIGTILTDAGTSSLWFGQVSGLGGLKKSGAGELILANANTYAGPTAISEGVLSVAFDQALGDSSSEVQLGNGTLRAINDVTSNRHLVLNGNGDLNVSVNNLTWNGNIDGPSGLRKTGAGVLRLGGFNSYLGGTVVQAGTLEINDDTQLGDTSGNLVLDGAVLRNLTNMTTNRQIVVTANGAIINAGANDFTSNGDIGGFGALTFIGRNIVLNGNKTYAGGTLISNLSRVTINSATSLGVETGVLTMNDGATLAIANDVATSRNINVNGGDIAFDTQGHELVLSGTLDGAPSRLIKRGAGRLTLTGTNNVTGDNIIDEGILSIDGDDKLGFFTGYLGIDTDGTLEITKSATFNSYRGLAMSGTIDTQNNDVVWNGVVTALGFTKVGAGRLTLTNSSNFFNTPINIKEGTLSIATDSQLGATSNDVKLYNGSTLEFTDNIATSRQVNLNNGGAIVVADGKSVDLTTGINGSGDLTKAGNGTLSLSNLSTYDGKTFLNGGTLAVDSEAGLGGLFNLQEIVFDGGALRFTNDSLSVRNMRLVSDGTIQTDTGHNTTIIGAITGTGSLTIDGSATIFNNTPGTDYSGGTILKNGILKIANDGALGNVSGALTFAGGTLGTLGSMTMARDISFGTAGIFQFINSDVYDLELSGHISGSSVPILQGTGVKTLSGDNSLFDGTFESWGGTLKLANSLSLGSLGSVYLADSTLDITTSLTTNGSLAGQNNMVVDTHDNNVTFGNLNSTFVPVTLNKWGTGTLTFTDSNSFFGDLIINEGAVALRQAVTTTPTGVYNFGRFRLLDNRFKTALYTGSGTLETELVPGVVNLEVTGNADITGGKLEIAGTPAQGTYTVINAGTLTGTFDSITANPTKQVEATYTGNQLLLNILTISNLGQNNPLTNGGTGSLARLLDDAAPTATGDLDTVITDLNQLSANDQTKALNQMSPLSFASLSGVTFAAARSQMAAVSDRMASLRNGAGNRFAAFMGNKHPDFLVADGPSDVAPNYFGNGNESKWGAFASASGSTGKQDAETNAQPGYDFSQGGTTVGFDYLFGEKISVGLSAGYMTGSADVDDNGGSTDVKSVRYGVYSTGRLENFSASLYAGGASNSYDTDRRVSSLGRTAKASPDGQELNLALQAGYDFKTRPVTIALIAGVGYDRLKIEKFTETGAGTLDLTVDEQTAKSLHSNVGLNISKPIARKSVTLVPYISGSWLHEYADQGRDINAQLSSVGTFQSHVEDVERNGALAGAGLMAGWRNGVSVGLGYSGEFRSDFANNGVNGHVRVNF